MDSRISLAPNTQLHFTNKAGGTVKYTIVHEIGRGGSSIVYDAVYETNPGDIKHIRLKECYPFKLRIQRLPDGYLEAEAGDSATFLNVQTSFVEDFSLGNGLFYSADLSDALNNTIDVYAGNGTVYLASSYSPECTMAMYHPNSLQECISLVKQVAYTVQKIHDAGYLYLDIKPENVLVIEGYSTRVQLFDLDSLFPIKRGATSPLTHKSVKLSYSKGFAPIELQTARLNKLGPYTDVYSIGALLFNMLFGDAPCAADCEANSVYDYSKMCFADGSYQDQLFFALTDFFHKALANFYLDRYSNMTHVIAALNHIEHLADITMMYIHSTRVFAPEIVGRSKELKALECWLNQDNVPLTFVTGMGGIGKSTLVKSFILRNRSRIDNMLYLSYKNSVDYTLSDDDCAAINTIAKDDRESLPEYFSRKLKAFRRAVEGSKTVLVIDNFDTAEIDSIRQLQNIGWKIIIISRARPRNCLYPIISVEAFDSQADLFSLFSFHLRRPILDQDTPHVANIISRVAGHTYAIELIAKQIASSHISVQQASTLVDEHGFSEIGAERIYVCQDDKTSIDTITNILTALYRAEHMSEVKHCLLKTAALFSDTGVDINQLHEFLGVKYKDDINELIHDGWVQLNENLLTIHPLIKETIHCWGWSEKAIEAAEAVMTYMYREIKIEADKEDYPLRLLKIIDASAKHFEKHPWLRKIFDWYTARHHTVGAVVRERYTHHSNTGAQVTDHAKVTHYVRLAEGVLHNTYREPVLRDKDIRCDLLYVTILNMPRYCEEYILREANSLKEFTLRGFIELTHHPHAHNGICLMKLYGCIMTIHLEHRDQQLAHQIITEARETANKFRHKHVWALFYDLLSDYYDALLNGAYESEIPEESILRENLFSAIEKAIHFSRRSRVANSKQLLAKNLLAKAKILMRTFDSDPIQIKKLLAEAKHLVDTEAQEFSRLRGQFYMVLAWHYALVEPNINIAHDCMVVARYISKQNAATSLDEIDNALVPCAVVYRNLEHYAEAAKLLLDGIDMCENHSDIEPYIRKKMELYLHLLDICFEWKKYDICKSIIEDIETANLSNKQYGVYTEIPSDIRTWISQSTD